MKTKTYFLVAILVFGALKTISAITAREFVDRVIEKIAGSPYQNSVDVFKEGNPDDEVTGVAVCMFATMDVLQQAVKNKCNFIITHEPTYYNHLDATDAFKDDPVVTDKRKFIRDHHLIIWRFHDYMHSIKPDGVLVALADKLEWKKYATSKTCDQFVLPETSLKDIIDHVKSKFPGISINVVGNLTAKISNVCLTPGAPGSMSHINCFTKKNADLVIGGEVQQWETYEYVRDAAAQGKNKAIIFLGHIPSEDPGVEYSVTWLKATVPEVLITFVECGPSYKTF